MGRYRTQENRTQATPDQESGGGGPEDACGLQQDARHHLGEARQEGGEVHGQGPAVPVHEQGAVRAQHGHAVGHGVEYAGWVPERDVAEGGYEGESFSFSWCG